MDCARWFGELVISKSVDNKLLFWLPELEGYDARSFQEGRYTIVQVCAVLKSGKPTTYSLGSPQDSFICVQCLFSECTSRKCSRMIVRACGGSDLGWTVDSPA